MAESEKKEKIDKEKTKEELLEEIQACNKRIEFLESAQVESKRIEGDLRESEKKYHTLFNKISDPIFIFDRDTHKFLDFNEACMKTYGFSREEMKGMTPFDLHAPEDLKKIQGTLTEGADDALFTYTHISKYGQKLSVEIFSDEIEYDGKPAWISIVRDVTERKLAEEQLRMSHDQLEQRVQVRAKEIEDVNKQIKKEIAEKKMTEGKLKESFDLMQKTLGGIVHAMAIVVEARDPYTAGHQRRVAELATSIAKHMSLDDIVVEGIRVACLLHDVGKITIPIEILSKPGKLNEVEFSFIKKHPQVGFDILKGIEFPWKIAQIVYQHHERIDGSGYPSGLKRDEILMESRILGVADVVEAMSSHRPYRPARGVDKALGEILENRGVLYEPDVVNTCLKLFAEQEFDFK